MQMVGWGLVTLGMVSFGAASLFGGARSLLISTAVFVAGIIIYAMS